MTAPRFPGLGDLLTLQADLHQHTVFSDGVVWPHVRVEEARTDGLDVIAISDHVEWQPHASDLGYTDHNRGYEIASAAAALPAGLSEGDHWILARREAGDLEAIAKQRVLKVSAGTHAPVPPEKPILVLRAAEITRGEPEHGRPGLGHVVAVNLSDINALHVPDALDALAEARRQDAFGIWCHPWSSPAPADGVSRLGDWHADLITKGLISGIEVANNKTYSAEAFQIALDHDLTLIGSSDVHGLISSTHSSDRGQLRPLTLVFAEDRSVAAVAHALSGRRTAVLFRDTLIGREEWVRPLLAASLTVGAARYHPLPAPVDTQQRPATAILRASIVNASGIDLLLRPVAPCSLASNPAVVTVPRHGSVPVDVLTGVRRSSVELRFEVLNALVAPCRSPQIVLSVAVDPG